MKIFDYFHFRREDKRLLAEIIQRWDEVTVFEYDKISVKHVSHNGKKYVAQVGIYFEDMMDTYIPEIAWRITQEGNIQPKWAVHVLENSPRGKVLLRRHKGNTPWRLYDMIPMSKQTVDVLEEQSKELWTLFKLQQ